MQVDRVLQSNYVISTVTRALIGLMREASERFTILRSTALRGEYVSLEDVSLSPYHCISFLSPNS